VPVRQFAAGIYPVWIEILTRQCQNSASGDLVKSISCWFRMSNIHAWTLDRHIRSKERSVLHAFGYAAIQALLLVVSTHAAAQGPTGVASTVEVRVQMSWWMESSRGHSLVASVALEPLDRKGNPQDLRISENTTSIVRIPAGRYQVMTTSPMVINGRAYGWSIEVPLVAPVNYIRLSQENAVRLSMDDAIEAAKIPNAKRTGLAASRGATDSDAPVQISALLNRWIKSIKSRNLQSQMSCYAPRLASYREQRNVSREQVQFQKRRLLRLYPQIRRFELSDIDVRMDAGRATASAVESWNFANDEVNWRGRALISFEFARNNSGWVITSEREQLIPERSVAVRQSAETSVNRH
jgi:hypothetical protein